MINSPELREILRRIITCSEAATSVGKGKFGKDLLSIHWNGGKMGVEGRWVEPGYRHSSPRVEL